jgi:ribosomal protein S27AE
MSESEQDDGESLEPDEDVNEEVEDGVPDDDSGEEETALGNIDHDPEETGGCDACGVPESEILVVYDRNKDYPWKPGNPYSRVCPDCGASTFTAQSYWESQEVPYVIPKGEDEPKPLFTCPHQGCDGEIVGFPDECPTCGGGIEWEGGDGDGESESA